MELEFLGVRVSITLKPGGFPERRQSIADLPAVRRDDGTVAEGCGELGKKMEGAVVVLAGSKRLVSVVVQ